MRVLEILRRSLKVYKELRKTCDCSDCDVSRDKTDRRIAELEEAIKEYQELKARDKQKNCEECYKKVDAALKAIDPQPSSCDGCIHKPKAGDNYYDPCGECKRFYADMHTRTEEDEI
ncbi:MAG: hypothetical protein IBX43_05170 [Campylobacterales bacterium]|nr:hypothetical protein [Campylobacterales bacterium]